MTLLDVHKQMICRYKEVISQSSLDKQYWINFCDTAMTLSNPDKLSRWVGFIQGFLFANNLISIEEERNFSRKLYKPVYIQMGLDSNTIDIKNS